MKCQAKIIDNLGNKYYCLNEAKKELTIKTVVPHLNNKEKTRVKKLCNKHAKRTRGNHNYAVKHRGKHSVLTEKLITK